MLYVGSILRKVWSRKSCCVFFTGIIPYTLYYTRKTRAQCNNVGNTSIQYFLYTDENRVSRKSENKWLPSYIQLPPPPPPPTNYTYSRQQTTYYDLLPTYPSSILYKTYYIASVYSLVIARRRHFIILSFLEIGAKKT